MNMPSTLAEPTDDIVPGPKWRRSGDLIWTGTILPIRKISGDGHEVVRSNSPRLSQAATQTRFILEELERVLNAAGTTMERLVRVEVTLSDVTHYYDFLHVWREYFREDPPARSTIVTGPDHVSPGIAVTASAVALAGDSSLSREVIVADGAPDPMPLEHAPHAIRVGPLLLPSSYPATDFVTGIPVNSPPGFPYFWSDTERQTRYILDYLGAILSAGGSDHSQALKVQLYLPELSVFPDMDRVWMDYFGPVPPTRSAVGIRGLTIPSAYLQPNFIFLVPDERHEKLETRKGIAWHPVDDRGLNFTPGITAGPWLFLAGQLAVPHFAKEPGAVLPPAGLPNHYSVIALQTDVTLSLLEQQITANGMSLADVAFAIVFIFDQDIGRAVRELRPVWESWFAPHGGGPPLALIPAIQASGAPGVLIPDPVVEIDFICWRDDQRA